MTGIYCIKNQVTNEIYVGQSVNIERRWEQHKKAMKTKKYQLYSSMRKYGLHRFTLQVLEECPKHKLDEREKYWIERKQKEGFFLYNIIGVHEKEKYIKTRTNKISYKRK